MGGPQSGGGSALMPKGDKPKGPELIPVAEVARRLNVEASQVESWMQKDQLRGNDSGIRPYDYKKFTLDFQEEIKRAQKEAAQGKRTKSDRKPKKGFLSKFRSMFGGAEAESEGGGSNRLAEENKKLKAEIKKLKKLKPDGKGGGGSKDQEEKIRFLEGKLSENRALESEVARLKKQLSDQPSSAPGGEPDPNLSRELEEARRELEEAKRNRAEADRFLSKAQKERDELQRALQEHQSQPQDNPEIENLQSELAQRAEELSKLQHRAQGVFEENSRLRAELETSGSGGDPLVDELLDLQKRNLERFRRLHDIHVQAQQKLEGLQKSEKPSPERDKDFRILKAKYKKLLAQKSQEGPAQQEVIDQLSSARLNVTKLKQENDQLREQMKAGSESDDAYQQKITELETKLKKAKSAKDNTESTDRELATLKKGLQVKENQVQKVATRLADNEKRLAKALQESARLTELLIERENRLRELSTEFEQEYRDKMENLDRQVSGLQWKLSLREERIAHLESELLAKGD